MTEADPVSLVIDLGTTDVKGGLVSHDGRMLASTRRTQPLAVDASTGRAEQDPDAWWAAIREVVRELADASDAVPAALCIVGQGPTMVPVDGACVATHPAITWLDGRPVAEALELEDATGLAGWGLGILPAARWLERTEPAAAARTAWYLNSWEWAAFRSTGMAATTRSLGQVLPSPERVAAGGLAVERLPPIVDSGSVVGRLDRSAAADLGLESGMPIVAGMNDAFASFLGAGLIDRGDGIDTGGTSGGLAVYWDAPVDVPGSWVAPAPVPERWLVGGAMTATGRALDWLADDILGGIPVETLIAEAAAIPPGCDGLVFLPYLAGERSPLWDPAARGAFVGLTLAHGRAHLARAVLEAAAYALRHVAAPIRAAGLDIDHLVVTGGTARSEVWNRIKADVLGVPVVVPAVRETALLGAAMLGAVAVGSHADLGTAIRAMVRVDHRIKPDRQVAATYAARYELYADLWPAIAPVVHRLDEASARR